MLTRSLLTLLCVLLLVSVSHALEPGDTLWTRTYGGSGGQCGRSIQQTSDGGYIITGRTKSGVDSYDLYLLKTDFSGDTLWTRTYGGSEYDEGYSVWQTSDGGYIIVGQTESFGAGLSDVYLLKTDSSGDILWTRIYGGNREDRGYSVRQTSDGGYIIAGETHSFGVGLTDVYLLKTDSSGDTLWTGTYGGRSNDWGYSVQETSDGGYIIAGRTESFGAGLSGVYLVKTDFSGDTLWTRTHGGRQYDRGEAVQQTSDGGYIVVGLTESFGAGLSDVYLLKIDPSGDTLWTRTYGGSDYELGHSVWQTSDGGYIIAGETYSFGAGLADVYLVKTDSSGDSLWACAYGGSDRDRGYSVQQTRDGGYVVAAVTYSFGGGSSDVYLIGAAGGVMIGCDNSSAWCCPGSYFLFKLTISNLVGENISGSLSFSGHSGYNCDPMNVLVSIPRTKTYPPGVTEQYYRFWIGGLVPPGQ
jgi:hypothetical protein